MPTIMIPNKCLNPYCEGRYCIVDEITLYDNTDNPVRLKGRCEKHLCENRYELPFSEMVNKKCICWVCKTKLTLYIDDFNDFIISCPKCNKAL